MTNISKRLGSSMYRLRRSGPVLLFGLAGLMAAAGCGRSDRLDPAVEKLGRATGPVEPALGRMAEAMPVPQAPQGTDKRHRGTVLETIAVPNYTYIRFRTPTGEERWAAVPRSEALRPGSSIEIIESLVMTDFPSRSLGRTFPSIIFGVLGTAAPAATEAPGGTEDAGPADSGAGDREPPRPALPPGHPPVNAR